MGTLKTHKFKRNNAMAKKGKLTKRQNKTTKNTIET